MRAVRLIPRALDREMAWPRRPDPLQARAERLWPNSTRNQAEWMRAVRVVRSTVNGWLLERPVSKGA